LKPGYVNDPSDPGGETQWGISKRSYPDVDIKALTREPRHRHLRARLLAARARRRAAAKPSRTKRSTSPSTVASRRRSASCRQQRASQTTGTGADDARAACGDAPVLVMRYVAERMHFQRRLARRGRRFGAGWTGRNADNLILAAGDIA
jgi:hypothetical protein